MKKVSVIIPVYNAEKYIEETLSSVFKQTYKNYEIIAVDDGSTDKSYEIVNNILKKPHIILKKENGGEASARNLGLQHASGDYIAFLDADDLFKPDKLEIQVDFLRKKTEYQMVYSDYEYIIEEKKTKMWGNWDTSCLNYGSGDIFMKQFIENRINTLTVLVKKECFDKAGVFDESIPYASDSDMWIRLSAFFQIGYLPETVASYRLHDTNISLEREICLIHRINSLEKIYIEFKDKFNNDKNNIKPIRKLYFYLIKKYLKKLKILKAYLNYKKYCKFKKNIL